MATLIGITVVAYALADVLHEGLGHGGACLLTGGRPLALSTVHFDCSADNRLVDAGGTLVNLAAGAIAWGLARRVRSPQLRFFLWLSMAVNLLQGAGYFLYSGVASIGDWSAFIVGLSPVWAWRIALVIVGAVLYAWFVWICVCELLPLLGSDPRERWREARRLALTAYLAGGALSCAAGLLNPIGMVLVAVSAAAASLGGTSGLAWMWELIRNPALPEPPVHVGVVGRRPAWIAAGAIVAAVFIARLGPGVRFR
jgi:hypothetical protein